MEEQRSAPARPLWVRIQTIRGERGWSWERLERELGVSRTTIDKWKVAPRSPQASTVNKVARVLGIDQEEALRLAGILPPAPAPEPRTLEDLSVEELRSLVDEVGGELARRREKDERDQGERRDII